MHRKHTTQFMIGLAAMFLCAPAMAAPVGTAFTYQGQLKNTGSPVNGNTNMAFSLWDDPAAGTQQGPTLTFDGAGGNPAADTTSPGPPSTAAARPARAVHTKSRAPSARPMHRPRRS
jgi:hypothetical protein